VNTVTLLGGKADLERIASLLSLHRLFETRDDLSFALDIGQRFAANRGIDDVFVVVGEGVVKNNNGARGDLHKKGGVDAGVSASGTVNGWGRIASVKRSG